MVQQALEADGGLAREKTAASVRELTGNIDLCIAEHLRYRAQI